MKKTAIEAALEFSSKQSLFTFEDTGDKCYRDFIEVLEKVNWKRIPYRKKSKVEKKKLPPRDVPRLIATLNEGDIDFTDLTSEQWVNHFEGVSQLTTKQGLCDLTRDLSVFQAHADEVVPRCYNLGDAMQRDEFIDDFRLTAAVIVLKFYFSQRLQNILIVGSAAAAASTSTSASTSATATMNSNKSTANNSKATSSTASSSVEMSSSVFQNAMYALQWQLRVKLYGEWPEVDISKHFKDKEIPLVDKEWWEITEKSYEYARIQRDDDFVLLAKLLGHIPTGLSAEVKAQLHRNFTPIDFKVMQMLKLYMQINPQFWMDGNRNIWIMKSPDSSCGIGMRISYRLEEILDIERGMGGRIVQKYTEIPLLAPMTRQMTMQVWKQIHKGGGSQMASMKWAKCKFDLRVWVVVTRLSPGLEAYIYPVVYGRRCSTVYHNDVQSLSEHYVHLTNYSLQKKAMVNTSSSTSAAEDTQGSSKKNKLRKICKDARSQPSSFSLTQDLSNTGKTNEEELLIRFDELQQIFQLHFLEQKSQQRLSRELTTLVKDNQIEEIWRDFLFPKIKAQVLTVLQSFSVHESVKARANSYELLGVDVLVDQCLDARILEVNMSPAMAHRTPEQSAVIRLMAQQFMALHFLPKLPEPHILKDFQEWIDEEEASFSEALPWQTWQPLHPESVEDSGEAASSPDPIQPQETDARAAPLDDWDVMEEVRPPPLFRSSSFSNNVPRPKSASATTTATASFRRRSFVQNDDPSLVPVPPPPLGGGGSSLLSYVLVGKAVSVSSMNYIDFLCKQFHLIVRLQRWWRLKLKHCRYHRQRRNQACIKMQCTIRTYVAKRRRLHLLHARYCQHIQSRLLRRCLRKRFQIWIWRRHAAVLSFHFKKYLLKKRRFEQLRRKAAIKLQRFIRRCHRKKLWINYRKLVFVFYHYKRWLNRKVRVIAGVIKLWFGRRVRYIKLIQASVRQYFVKLKLHRAYLKIKLKQLASEAKVRLGHVLTLKKERQYMCAEEKASAELRHLPIFTPPLPPPEVDEIAIQEVVQEAVIVVEEKEITPSLPPGISESSLADAKEVTLFPEDKRTAKKLPRSNQEATFAPASSNCSLAEDKVDVAVKQAPEILTFEEFLARPLEDNRGIPLPKERPGKHTRPSANALTGSWDEDAIQKSSMLHASRFLRNGVAADHHEIPIPPGQQHLGNNTNGMQKISRPYHPTSIDHSAAEFQSPQSPRAAAAVLHFDYNVNNHNTVENQGRHDNTVYSAQSLHEVLRERQAMFHLRQNQQQLHLHPSSGLDDFFTSTLAQPSPSPILSPFYQPADAFYSNAAGSRGVRPTTSQASISGATGLLGSKSRPTSASSTSAPSKLKHSNTSSTTHTSSNHSVGGMTLNTNAIYNSGSGVIASPRATKKERPKSAGTGRSKKDKENEKKKKDRISAIYLYK